jgi:protein TonB
MRTAQSRLDLADEVWALGNGRNDRSAMGWALAAAVVVHLLFLLVNLPNATPPDPPEKKPPVDRMRPIWFPPPPSEDRALPDASPREPTSFVPFPTADPTEPVTEQTHAVEYEVANLDVDVIFDDAIEPPPLPPEPGRPGINGVTIPVLIADSKVAPDYPELARAARLGGRVILEAVIRSDGTVAEVSVLQCTRPDLGFEEAAIDAIRQWRYEPARQNGVPVDVYFTVVVEFTVQ